eukprot:GHUV01012648.1.p1 GENE.GHUV01012648.1~~GHUV01012648.1.p1  ORF type:complete len:234 (-),score=58.91 GHUV01012648.1:949-1650(-)
MFLLCSCQLPSEHLKCIAILESHCSGATNTAAAALQLPVTSQSPRCRRLSKPYCGSATNTAAAAAAAVQLPAAPERPNGTKIFEPHCSSATNTAGAASRLPDVTPKSQVHCNSFSTYCSTAASTSSCCKCCISSTTQHCCYWNQLLHYCHYCLCHHCHHCQVLVNTPTAPSPLSQSAGQLPIQPLLGFPAPMLMLLLVSAAELFNVLLLQVLQQPGHTLHPTLLLLESVALLL